MGSSARRLAFVLLLLTSGVPALAEDARPTPETEHRTLEQFGDANKECREWTDGCAICLRHDDGAPACSLPGIACEPTPVVCKPTVAPREPPNATPPKDESKDQPKASSDDQPAAPKVQARP